MVPELILDRAHTTLGHLGPQRTAEYVRRWFWWPTLRRDVDKFCTTCGICHMAKASTHKPTGLLHSMPVPRRPWESISMDFVGPFPVVFGCDYIWVVVDRMTSMVHLIPIRTMGTAADLALVYLREVVRLHGLPESIVSDRDSKFTSKFWKELHRLLGAKLLMSTAFHPQTDGLSEQTCYNFSYFWTMTLHDSSRLGMTPSDSSDTMTRCDSIRLHWTHYDS